MFWYNDEVAELEQKKVLPKGDKPRLLCYGSSSMRLWPDIENTFPEFDVINQAFGGSTLAACCWFFKRLIPQYRPDLMAFYAGDNDLGDGRHPEEVFFFFKNLMALIKEHCGDIPVAFISVKPSFARNYLLDSIKFTNKIIKQEISDNYPNCTFVSIFDEMLAINENSKELFEEDGLHISPRGYELWDRILRAAFLNQFISHKKDIPNIP